MDEKTLTQEELKKRREIFFETMNKEYPPIKKLIATNSGILENFPKTQEEWDNYHENLHFVEGVERHK